MTPRKIILALAGSAVFAAVDLYLINLSSYVAGFLLVLVLVEGRRS